MERNSQQMQRGRPVSGMDAAHANEYFEQFLNATSLKHILGYYRGLIDNLHLKPNVFSMFYPKLRANLTSWRAKALWKKFDARASHKCYQKGKAASNTRVLIIGGGPCGLRSAIEAQLLGAKVVVVEKRDRFSRNNVLHLWPFVIEDLRMLGAKKFFGKFCAGAIDHISIRQLQCILLKVALLLGVEVHTEVSFEKLIDPNPVEKIGWRAEFKPSNHPVHHYEFDVIIGADGKRNTLQGFSRKEFRGKLAIAITANFINRKTEAEARVEEISGVAFIFNQKFFKDLQHETRIDLENIVYYKDDTHYFVMTAKKASLLEKGVIKEDLADTEKLLAPDNVDRKALEQYAIDAANFSTNYQLPDLEFAVNHYGQPDIAMFDFTSMYAAENASKVVERHGYRLLMILVGDSLLEPFWPTGSGCARGFLSSLDAAWAIRSWSLGTTNNALEVLAERESIYRLLAQTTPDNLNKDWKSYTLDPATRYPNLNKTAVMPHQITGLFDTDNPGSVEKMKRNLEVSSVEVPRKKRRGNVDNEVLLDWFKQQLKDEADVNLENIQSVFKDGKALCAIVYHYRPDLLDYPALKDEDPARNNQTAFDILEKELGIPPVMTGEEITKTEDFLTMATYLTEVYDTFRREIPHIKHPKLVSRLFKKKKNLPLNNPLPKPPSKQRTCQLNKSSTKVVSLDPFSKISKSKLNKGSLHFEKKENLPEIPNFVPIPTICKTVTRTLAEIESNAQPKQNSDTQTLPQIESNVRSKQNIDTQASLEIKSNAQETQTLPEIEPSDTIITINYIEKKPKNKITLRNMQFVASINQLTISSKITISDKNEDHFASSKENDTNLKRLLYDLGRMQPSGDKKYLFHTKRQFLPENKENLKLDMSNSQCQNRSKENFSLIKMIDDDGDFRKTSHRIDNDGYDIIKEGNAIKSKWKEMLRKNEVRKRRSEMSKFWMQGKEKYPERIKNSHKLKSVSEPPRHFTIIEEADEIELPVTKKMSSELSFKSVKTGFPSTGGGGASISRPSSRHKRHVDPGPVKVGSMEKKTRKRRTLEKNVLNWEERQKTREEIASNRAERQSRRRQQRQLQTEHFLKSMQMLQANAKHDSQPFEDYSIFLYRQTAPKFEDRVKDLEKQFTYIPDHDGKAVGSSRTGGATDEDLAARIKNLEKKWTEPQPVDKKPKDLMRAIGKIETTDWNIKEIEKKILENKMGKPSKTFDKEKVPKWSKEQFLARQTKMESKHLDRQDSAEAKFADIDKSIKNLDRKLKEGTVRQLGTNKVASLTEKLVSKIPNEPKAPVEKTPPKTPVVISGGSEYCHFCKKRVYLMERLSAEGRFFHHSCFKCQYCNVQLRLGSYTFDRDGLYGFKFFCLQHFGMISEIDQSKIVKKSSEDVKSVDKKPLPGIVGVDLLDRVQTPERVEFANLSTAGNVSSDQDEPLSQIDEDEWTDKNFGASCAELADTDDDSSSLSDTDSDDEGAFDDALEEPITKEGTMKWAERWKNSYSKKRHKSESDEYTSTDRSSYYDSSDDEESDTATEGEEEIRARELRRQEVQVEPPVVQTDTGTDTEVISDESSSESSSSEIQNSATEISTDSEFAQDDPTPTREIQIYDDFRVTKTRGSRNVPKKIQVTSGYLQKFNRNDARKPEIELKLKPLVLPSPPINNNNKRPALDAGYMLNRTHSTGGIAAKVSLELKKKYLLGENSAGGIQKSGSVSTLDNKFKTFQNTITDCQKLLKPASEISASMLTFCTKLDERKSPVFQQQSKKIEEKDEEIRPRSPAHQTSIIVPQIDWNKTNDDRRSLSDDSLIASSDDDDDENLQMIIPTVEVHEVQDEPFDSLCETNNVNSGEIKTLNQPKLLPDVEEVHNSLHECRNKNSSSPDSATEVITAALTETELSDWARDEAVSDDLDDVYNDYKLKNVKDKVMIINEALNDVLSSNLDNIEYMDTGSETSTDDGVHNSQDGYVLLKNEEEFTEDSLNPNINNKIEKNAGYCIIEPDIKEDSLTVTESDSTVKNVTELKKLDPVEEITTPVEEKIEFDEHCQRLQSKIEFGNAKDSINVRKSRRKSKSDSPQKPDLIQEENKIDKNVNLNLSPAPHTPDILYNKEIIKKERDVNKKLIQEMVMNKMRAENKSLERKKRVRSGIAGFLLQKSATVSQITMNNTPDVLLSTKLHPETEETTPKAPPRRNNMEEMQRKLEKLKLAVENPTYDDSLNRKNSFRRSKSVNSETTPTRTKSIQEMVKSSEEKDVENKEKLCKSDPNIVDINSTKLKKKCGNNDPDRRKSLTKMITTLFTKKSPTGKGRLFGKLSPNKSKEPQTKDSLRRNSFTDMGQSVTPPPPVPPLPSNYKITKTVTDESSEGELDVVKKDNNCSSDNLDKSGTLETSNASNSCRRSGKAQKVLRQAQLKRHRMAQEVQRKLEETEVKTKELEERGVLVEKALRGENSEYSTKDECELLQEWFDLMRDRTELRRYEKELIVRAQELELEDRHARLQCELRIRLENNEPKTEEELKGEEEIINEMMSIVAERDSLIATIEEDRLRYSNEDKDMEEQMLAKGLRLTPIKKSTEK